MSELVRKSVVIKSLTGWDTDATDEEIAYTVNKLPVAEPSLEEVALYCKRRHYVIITAELFHFLADGVPGITPVPKLEQMYGKDVSGVIVSEKD